MQESIYQEKEKRSIRWELLLLALQIVGVLFLIYLPFLGLIRSGIYFYHAYNFNTWIGLFLGVVFSVGVIAVYTFTIKKLMNRNSKMRWKTTKKVGVFIFLLVISYVIFSLLSFSGKNAQSNKVKSEYSELHPYLKISVRTFLFFDNELIITDLSRTSDDYTKMGLKKKDSSLHFIQNTGYTHAMDLRTRDRPFWMIWSAQLYFKSLGFNAVRHGGTGDHLHVSLSTYEKQRSW